MSSISSLAQRIILPTLLLDLLGCGEPPVYTRSALDAGAASDHPPLSERGPSPAGGGGGAGSASGGMTEDAGISGAGGDATNVNGGGPSGGTRAGSGGGVVTAGGQTGTGAAGQGGSGGVVAPGGKGGITPGSGGAAGSTGVAATGGAPPGTGGSSSSGGMGGGFTCGGIEPVSPGAGLISDFASITALGSSWTASNGVTGRPFDYHVGMPSAAMAQLGAIAHDLHCTANVGNGSYAGCGIVIDGCLAAGANTAVRFSISGRSSCEVALQIQTYERRPSTETPAGGCTTTCGDYSSSASLTLSLTLNPSPVTVALSTLANWTTASASQIVGVQWQMTNPAGKTSCTTDLRFDDIALVP